VGLHRGCDGAWWALKLLTILDEHTRECHVLWAERALKAADVLHWLQQAVAKHGAPEFLRSDNGSEFIAKIVQRWLKEHRIKTIHIEPGSPWQNGLWKVSMAGSGTNA